MFKAKMSWHLDQENVPLDTWLQVAIDGRWISDINLSCLFSSRRDNIYRHFPMHHGRKGNFDDVETIDHVLEEVKSHIGLGLDLDNDKTNKTEIWSQKCFKLISAILIRVSCDKFFCVVGITEINVSGIFYLIISCN